MSRKMSSKLESSLQNKTSGIKQEKKSCLEMLAFRFGSFIHATAGNITSGPLKFHWFLQFLVS